MQQAVGPCSERSERVPRDQTQLVPTILLSVRRRTARDSVTDQGSNGRTAASQEVLRKHFQGMMMMMRMMMMMMMMMIIIMLIIIMQWLHLQFSFSFISDVVTCEIKQ